jgi:putative aldouronate transport system permease protein
MLAKDAKVFHAVAAVILFILVVVALLPFLLLVMSSFTDEVTAIRNGYTMFPKKLSISAYQYILVRGEIIGRAYLMTILVAGIGTSCSLIVASMLAYGLSVRKLPFSGALMFFVIFTMLFNGGLVPTYYIYTKVFQIKNTIAALLFPNIFLNAFNVILLRSYFRNSIPYSLIESSSLDGASEFFIYRAIVLPLSTPIMATVGLLTTIMYWNDWMNGLYYVSDSSLYTIQLVLRQINENIAFLANNSAISGDTRDIPGVTVRMAIAVLGILPILCTYPFFQKYFVKGIALGAIKG